MNVNQMDLLSPLHFDVMSDRLKQAVTQLREGNVILLLDSLARENEGDLIVAGDKITAETMNFLIRKGSGVVCLALPKSRLDQLNLPLMMPKNTNMFNTAFTVSIEAKTGVTTGVSAADRTRTIQAAMADDAVAEDLARPGHVFPLAANEDGVFERMGHTEGSVDLMRIAGLKAGAVLCELMNDDGSMMVGKAREDFAARFGIPVVSVEEILCHRMRTEHVATKTSKNIKTRFGSLAWHSFNVNNAITVDIFLRDGYAANTQPTQPLRLSLIDGSNSFGRLMAQVLLDEEDEPLKISCNQLQDHCTDAVVITTTKTHDTSLLNSDEIQLHIKASIAKALSMLHITTLSHHDLDDELARIASTYFYFSIR